MASRHPARRQLQNDCIPLQDFPRDERLLLVHHAIIVVKSLPRGALPVAMSVHCGHRLRFSWRNFRLHVRVWRNEVLLIVSLRGSQVDNMYRRCSVYDSLELADREHCGGVGHVHQQAQVLRREERDAH